MSPLNGQLQADNSVSRAVSPRAWLVCAAAGAMAALWMWPNQPFLLDDAYITLHAARHLGEPVDPSFAGATPMTGITSPAYLLLIWILGRSIPLELALSAASGLGWAVYLSGLWAVGQSLQLRYRLALLCSGVILARTLFQLVNGLKTSLALGLLTWTCIGFQRPRLPHWLGLPRWNLAVPSTRVRRVLLRGCSGGILATRFVLSCRPCGCRSGLDGTDARPRRRDTTDDDRGQTSVLRRASFAVRGDVRQGRARRRSRVWPGTDRHCGPLPPSYIASLGDCSRRPRGHLLLLPIMTYMDSGRVPSLPGAPAADRTCLRGPPAASAVQRSHRRDARLGHRDASDTLGSYHYRKTYIQSYETVSHWLNRHPVSTPILVHDAGYISDATRFPLVDLVGLKTPL